MLEMSYQSKRLIPRYYRFNLLLVDHSFYQTLQHIKKSCKRVIHSIREVMNDEECGYTVNRIEEYE